MRWPFSSIPSSYNYFNIFMSIAFTYTFKSKMSRIAIVTLKICPCTLVSIIVVLMLETCFKGVCSGRLIRLSLWSLLLVENLTLKRGLGEALHTLVGNWSRSLVSLGQGETSRYCATFIKLTLII